MSSACAVLVLSGPVRVALLSSPFSIPISSALLPFISCCNQRPILPQSYTSSTPQSAQSFWHRRSRPGSDNTELRFASPPPLRLPHSHTVKISNTAPLPRPKGDNSDDEPFIVQRTAAAMCKLSYKRVSFEPDITHLLDATGPRFPAC